MTKYVWKGDPERVEECDDRDLLEDDFCAECCPGCIDGKCCFNPYDEIRQDLPEDIIDNLEKIETD